MFFKQTTVILSFSLLGRRKSKEEKEVSVWGFGPKWSVYSQFGPNISMMNPNPKQRKEEEEKRRRRREEEEEEEEKRGGHQAHLHSPVVGDGRPLIVKKVSRYQQANLLVRALGEVGDGRPHHEGEEEQAART